MQIYPLVLSFVAGAALLFPATARADSEDEAAEAAAWRQDRQHMREVYDQFDLERNNVLLADTVIGKFMQPLREQIAAKKAEKAKLEKRLAQVESTASSIPIATEFSAPHSYEDFEPEIRELQKKIETLDNSIKAGETRERNMAEELAVQRLPLIQLVDRLKKLDNNAKVALAGQNVEDAVETLQQNIADIDAAGRELQKSKNFSAHAYRELAPLVYRLERKNSWDAGSEERNPKADPLMNLRRVMDRYQQLSQDSKVPAAERVKYLNGMYALAKDAAESPRLEYLGRQGQAGAFLDQGFMEVSAPANKLRRLFGTLPNDLQTAAADLQTTPDIAPWKEKHLKKLSTPLPPVQNESGWSRERTVELQRELQKSAQSVIGTAHALDQLEDKHAITLGQRDVLLTSDVKDLTLFVPKGKSSHTGDLADAYNKQMAAETAYVEKFSAQFRQLNSADSLIQSLSPAALHGVYSDEQIEASVSKADEKLRLLFELQSEFGKLPPQTTQEAHILQRFKDRGLQLSAQEIGDIRSLAGYVVNLNDKNFPAGVIDTGENRGNDNRAPVNIEHLRGIWAARDLLSDGKGNVNYEQIPKEKLNALLSNVALRTGVLGSGYQQSKHTTAALLQMIGVMRRYKESIQLRLAQINEKSGCRLTSQEISTLRAEANALLNESSEPEKLQEKFDLVENVYAPAFRKHHAIGSSPLFTAFEELVALNEASYQLHSSWLRYMQARQQKDEELAEQSLEEIRRFRLPKENFTQLPKGLDVQNFAAMQQKILKGGECNPPPKEAFVTEGPAKGHSKAGAFLEAVGERKK